MKKILLALLAVATFSLPATAQTADNKRLTKEINNSFTMVEKKVREAAVKVVTSNGHGSGSLVKYKDMQLVLTARHVADGTLGKTYLVVSQAEQKLAVLIYSDPLNDIALLYLPNEIQYSTPMKYKPRKELVEAGESITYSGFPAWHSLLSFRGQVAGFEIDPHAGQQIILQTYGYYGSSGSVVYDEDGNIIGILWGVDVQGGQVQENIVWVSPIQNLDIKLALRALCAGMPEPARACK